MQECRVEVRLVPRARREEIVGERDGRLLVRVTAPPLDGRANDALCKLIARRAHVPVRAVSLLAGARSRDKLVRVEGVDERRLRAALGLPAARRDDGAGRRGTR